MEKDGVLLMSFKFDLLSQMEVDLGNLFYYGGFPMDSENMVFLRNGDMVDVWIRSGIFNLEIIERNLDPYSDGVWKR